MNEVPTCKTLKLLNYSHLRQWFSLPRQVIKGSVGISTNYWDKLVVIFKMTIPIFENDGVGEEYRTYDHYISCISIFYHYPSNMLHIVVWHDIK